MQHCATTHPLNCSCSKQLDISQGEPPKPTRVLPRTAGLEELGKVKIPKSQNLKTIRTPSSPQQYFSCATLRRSRSATSITRAFCPTSLGFVGFQGLFCCVFDSSMSRACLRTSRTFFKACLGAACERFAAERSVGHTLGGCFQSAFPELDAVLCSEGQPRISLTDTLVSLWMPL